MKHDGAGCKISDISRKKIILDSPDIFILVDESQAKFIKISPKAKHSII